MKKNYIIPIILVVISVLMMTIFNESLKQIDSEIFDFISALLLGMGAGMLLKTLLPNKKEKAE